MMQERRILDQQAAELRKLEKELSHANQEARKIAHMYVCVTLAWPVLRRANEACTGLADGAQLRSCPIFCTIPCITYLYHTTSVYTILYTIYHTCKWPALHTVWITHKLCTIVIVTEPHFRHQKHLPLWKSERITQWTALWPSYTTRAIELHEAMVRYM